MSLLQHLKNLDQAFTNPFPFHVHLYFIVLLYSVSNDFEYWKALKKRDWHKMVMAGTRGNLVTIKLLDCHEIFLLLLPEFEQTNFSSINPFMTEVVII